MMEVYLFGCPRSFGWQWVIVCVQGHQLARRA
jgi:hypothetical protein